MYLLVLSSQLVVGMSLFFTIELFSLQVYALSSKQEQIIIYICVLKIEEMITSLPI